MASTWYKETNCAEHKMVLVWLLKLPLVFIITPANAMYLESDVIYYIICVRDV